jgi:hypothetical protein
MSLTPLYSSSAFGVTSPDSLTLLINLEHSALGPTVPEVANAVRHLCGLLFADEELKPIPTDDYYEVARNYYEKFRRDDPSGAQSLSLICYVSTYFHELRHVHDLLSTKYGQLVFFKNLNFYQNAPSLAVGLAEWQERNPSNKIPLPITPYLSELPGLPEDICKLVTRYPKLHEDIGALQRPGYGFHSNLTVRHLLESSAAGVQFDFIYDVFGADAATRLIKFISEGPGAPEYWQINNDMAEAFYAKGFRGPELNGITNYLIWCALFGTIHPTCKGDGKVSIVVLYEALVEHVLHNIKRGEFAEVQALVEDFCQDWGFLTPAEMASKTRQGLEQQAELLEEAWRGLGAEAGVLLLASSYKQLIGGYVRLNNLIEAIPNQYFGNYGWTVLERLLPSVRILIKFDGSVLENQSPGHELLPLDSWDMISHLSTTLKVLLDGRDYDSDFLFLENESLNNLRTGAFGDVKLRFDDRKIPF